MTIDSAENALEGRARFSSGSYDLILINTPLADEFGDRLAMEAAAETDAGVLLLVKSELEEKTEKRVASRGVLVLAKPLNKLWFIKALRLLEATNLRLAGTRHEKDKLRQQLDEIRIVNRAKGILMEYLSMTEAQAHKYLEKQAMDLRITKAEVARRLLSTYEY